MTYKIGIITGVTGQDGSYLSELLLEKNYIVFGLYRKHSYINMKRIEHLLDNTNFILKYFDLTDASRFNSILNNIEKQYENIETVEIYNLGALSHVHISFELPEYSAQTNAIGPLKILEAIKESNIKDKCKFYQASTSELYGKIQEKTQNEDTPFYPRSPYAVSKLYAFWITKNYRESYGLYACNGILFNHESPRRCKTFVTKKITNALSKIYEGNDHKLTLGNLYAKRDWGHAKDYVKGMWLMLQQDAPEDFVLSTNETRTVKEFVETAFKLRGFNIKWKGEGLNEIGYDDTTGRELIFVSEKFIRPCEVDILLGDCSKAEKKLNWKKEFNFEELVKDMVFSQ